MADIDNNELMNAVKELRETVEKSKKDGLDEVKIKKIDDFLDRQEDLNQEVVKANEKARQLEDQVVELEKSLSRKGEDEGAWKKSAEWEAIKHHMKTGELIDTKTLTVGTDADGGYTVPTPLDNEIRKHVVELSPMRSICRTRTMTAKSLEIPIRTTIPTAGWKDEAVNSDLSQQVYAEAVVTNHRQTVTVASTRDLLNDSAFNMEAEIASDAALAFAKGEGVAFISGTGDANFQPEGILTNATLVAGARETANVGALDADDMLDLIGDIKQGYNPMYIFNKKTMVALRKLKDSQGQYLWAPSINGGVASTFAGENYAIMQDMPDIGAGNYAVAYGDFMRGYEIYDRVGMSVIRDNVTQARAQIINWTFARWLTGKVILPEAIKLLEIKAA